MFMLDNVAISAFHTTMFCSQVDLTRCSCLIPHCFVLFCRDGQVRAPLHCLNRNTAFFSGMENQRETQDQKICIWVNQNIYGRPVQEKRERRGMLESRLAFSLSLPCIA
jgi:hypothetical protein